MRYALIGVAIVIFVAVVGWVASRMLGPRGEQPGGFRQWVKDPDYRDSLAEYLNDRDSLEVPEDTSEAEIQQMVDRLFIPKDEGFNFDRLKLVGCKAVPALLKALDDPQTWNAELPFKRICGLLGEAGSPAATRPLAKYITHTNSYFRKEAALALGEIGATESLAPLQQALNDDDDYVRSYAMMGLGRGMEAKRCQAELLKALIPALTKLLNRNDITVGGEAPVLLLAIDAEQTLPVLLSPQYFTVENREVHYILKALNESRHKVPHDKLLSFLKTVKPLAEKYPHDYQYAEALKAYALNPDEATESTLRSELQSPNDNVREAAAKSLGILAGITNARDFVFALHEKLGFAKMSGPQQHYLAVFIYDAEVCNGGHSQYFANSSGEQWKLALQGMQAIGADSRAKVLQHATEMFGAAGPAHDRNQRLGQLSQFSASQDQTLGELDKRYYAGTENLEVLLSQYAIEHKEHFVNKK